MNWDRYQWLAMRHYERAFSFYARGGRGTVAEGAWNMVQHYRGKLGMPAWEGP